MSILLGLLAEIAVRVYFESQSTRSYFVSETYNLDVDPLAAETP
jgi:hypothetical protein